MKATQAASPTQLAHALAGLWRRLAIGGQSAAFAEIAEIGLSLTQVKALWLLEGCAESPTVGEIADRLGVSLPAASRTVEGLLRRGWAERREDEHDRRVKRASLTAEGRAVAQRIADARMQGLEAFAASLTDDQRTRLHEALEEID